MNKTDKLIAYILQQLNKIGENFGWMIGKVSANYENGYMKCTYDNKAHFKTEKVRKAIEAIINEQEEEVTEKVETNGDRIRNMSDEELAFVIMCPYDTAGEPHEIMPCIKDHGNNEIVPQKYCYTCTENWLKEKVE